MALLVPPPEGLDVDASGCRLTLELLERICAMLDHALFIETVRDTLGISAKDWNEWSSHGHRRYSELLDRIGHNAPLKDLLADLTPYRRLEVLFWLNLHAHLARAEGDLVKALLSHGKKDWRPVAWYLQRRYPTRYGDRANVEQEQAAVEDQELQSIGKERIREVLMQKLEADRAGEDDLQRRIEAPVRIEDGNPQERKVTNFV